MNAGFSAPVSYWGSIAGLTPKSSSDGKTSQMAEAANEYGDTAAHDEYGELLAPSTEYVVTGVVDLSAFALGSIGTWNTHKIMLTQVQVNTQAGQPPTVTFSGVEVDSCATKKRYYPMSGMVSLRSKAQDIVGAFTASAAFTQINTTFSVDPHVQTVAGAPVAADCSHGRVEVQATMTDPTGAATITAASGSGYAITAATAESNPDAGYQTKTATATKFIAGSETT